MKNLGLIVFILLLLGTMFVYQKYGYLIQSIKNLPPKTSDISPESINLPELTEDDKLLQEKISLPKGFSITYFAKNIPGARSMALGKNNTVFVGTKDNNVVYAVIDENADGKADKRIVIAQGLSSPNGVAYKDGNLFVAEISRILKFSNIDTTLNNKPKYQVIYDKYPKDAHHGWKYLAIGPDNKFYVPVGAPCNICNPPEPYASITRLNLDGTGEELIASGIRNTVGFDWSPETEKLWFTDNGRDEMGDDKPDDELNELTEIGQHFGYPFCHQGNILDPEFGKGKSCANYTSPAQNLGPHVASLGIKFYRGTSFPSEYKKKLFIAEHGSWNRTTPIGYRVTTVDVNGDTATNYKTFAEGWLDKNGNAWGRPVDILNLPDGSILVSDDKAGAIYRISYFH